MPREDNTEISSKRDGMDFNNVSTDVAILKKVIFGNGVKGLVEKVDCLQDVVHEMEIIMGERLAATLSEFRKELQDEVLNSKTLKNQTASNLIAGISTTIAAVAVVASLVF